MPAVVVGEGRHGMAVSRPWTKGGGSGGVLPFGRKNVTESGEDQQVGLETGLADDARGGGPQGYPVN